MSASRRVGSAIEVHLPAMKHLIEAGYRILVTGDRVVDKKYLEELGHQVVTAQWLDVDPRLFSLFAATESDIWIGNLGGAAWLPLSNKIPMLVMDAFPYGHAIPNAWMHYKIVRDADGNLIPYSQLFAEHAYDYEMSGWTVCNSSAEGVAAAVEEFLGELREPSVNDSSHRVLSSLPDYVVTKHVNCRLSLAWLRLFDDTEEKQA